MRFPLRIDGDDENLWARFRTWCDENHVSINSALLLLVKAAVDGKVQIGARRS